MVLVDIAGTSDTEGLLADGGVDFLSLQADVSSEAEVAQLSKEVRERLGRCDILVNNAGIFEPFPFPEASFEAWRRVLSVNLDSMLLMSRALSPLMVEQRWGRIVNISSNTVGLVMPGSASYITSKAGIVGLTRALATDLGAAGITVNAVLPGLTRTEATEAQEKRGALSFGDMVAQQAVPRTCLPSDVAAAVSFLASEEAGFITAHGLVVDGGIVRH